MKLPEITQIAFEGAAQASPFQPVEIPDPNPKLQANLATIARSFQNLESSGVEQYKRKELQAKQMEQLYEFAPKAIQSVFKIQDDIRESVAKATAAEVMLNTPPEKIKEAIAIDAARNKQLSPEEQNAADKLAVEEGRDLIRTPGNSELASLFVGYAGKQKKHINILLAKRLGVALPEWVSEQRKSNTGMMYLPQLGTSVRINDPDLPPTTAEAVRQQLMRSAMGIDEISGNDSMDLGIFAEHAVPLLQQNMLQIKQREDKTWRSTNGHNQRMMLLRKRKNDEATILGDKNLTAEQRSQKLGEMHRTFITAMAATTPLSGEDRGIGEAAATKKYEEAVIEAVTAGEDFDTDALGNAVVGPKGELFKDWNSGSYNRIKAGVILAQNKAFSNNLAAKQADVKQKVLSFNRFIEENEGEISFEDGSDQVRQLTRLALQAGMTPQQAGIPSIQSQLLMYGVGGEQRRQDIADAQVQAMNGTLSTSHPLFRTALGRTHPLYATAQQYDKNNLTPELGRIKEGIVNSVSKKLNVAKNLHGGIDGYAGQIADEFYESIRQEAADRLAEATTPEEKSKVVSEYLKNLTDPSVAGSIPAQMAPKSGSVYELDTTNYPAKWHQRQSQNTTEVNQMANQLSHLTSVAAQTGDVFSEIQNNPSSLVSRSVAVADMDKLLSGQSVGPYYQVAKERINKAAGKEIIKHPMQLLAAVYRSYEPEAFNQSKMEAVLNQREQLSPKYQQYLDRMMSGEHVNHNSMFRHGRETVREGFNGRVPPVSSAIAAVGTQKTYTPQQRAFANRVYELAKANGARHPEVAAAIASLETGFGRVQADNNVFNLRAVGGGFEKFATLEAAVKRFIKLWDKNHSGFRNLESFDDPNEAFAAIVNAYAPPADKNNPAAYKQFVADFIKSQGYLLGP